MKLGFEFHFKKKENYSEENLLGIISERITNLGKDMPIYSFDYQIIEDGFAFLIEYKSVLPGITYQPILGCFIDLDQVCDCIDNISMPAEKMYQEK